MAQLATSEIQRVGLIAGWGRYPLVVAQALKDQGHEVFCIALREHADPALREICDHVQEAGVARMGGHIRYFRRHGVTLATMAGKLFKHKLLFGRWGWLSLVPDLRTLRAYVPSMYIRRDVNRNDDAFLSIVIDEYARDGIHFAPATDFAPELLVKEGSLTRRTPSAAQWEDIRFGWTLAKELGRLDCGQSACVKGRAVLALEAVEGTDECIRRAGALCQLGGFTVVKVAKPQQDMRFDVPTIGVGTIEMLHAAGAAVLAIEADKTIVIDQAEVSALADQYGLAVIAVAESEVAAAAA
jgi:DUF1009 family protein